jgi:hypothetical protein
VPPPSPPPPSPSPPPPPPSPPVAPTTQDYLNQLVANMTGGRRRLLGSVCSLLAGSVRSHLGCVGVGDAGVAVEVTHTGSKVGAAGGIVEALPPSEIAEAREGLQSAAGRLLGGGAAAGKVWVAVAAASAVCVAAAALFVVRSAAVAMAEAAIMGGQSAPKAGLSEAAVPLLPQASSSSGSVAGTPRAASRAEQQQQQQQQQQLEGSQSGCTSCRYSAVQQEGAAATSSGTRSAAESPMGDAARRMGMPKSHSCSDFAAAAAWGASAEAAMRPASAQVTQYSRRCASPATLLEEGLSPGSHPGHPAGADTTTSCSSCGAQRLRRSSTFDGLIIVSDHQAEGVPHTAAAAGAGVAGQHHLPTSMSCPPLATTSRGLPLPLFHSYSPPHHHHQQQQQQQQQAAAGRRPLHRRSQPQQQQQQVASAERSSGSAVVVNITPPSSAPGSPMSAASEAAAAMPLLPPLPPSAVGQGGVPGLAAAVSDPFPLPRFTPSPSRLATFH